MNADNKKINWLPFFSCCALFIVIGTIGWFLGVQATPLAGSLFVVGLIAYYDVFSPPNFSFKDCWYNYIKTDAHIIIISLAVICSLVLLFLIIPKYDIKFTVKKKS